MSKTIFCTNPSCNAVIDIIDTVDAVVCTNCNTWQLVSMAQSANENDDSSGSLPPPAGENPLPPTPFQPPSEDTPLDTSGDSVIPPNLGYNELDEGPGPSPSGSSSSAYRPDATDTPELGYLNTEKGDRMKLKMGKNTIGRKGTDIEINDRTVSREHCILEVIKNEVGQIEYYIYDIGHDSGKSSTNGVFISGRSQRLEDFERIKLFNGSALTIGNIRLFLTT